MSDIVTALVTEGICELPGLYSTSEIAKLNLAIDPLLAGRIDERRAYVHFDEMLDTGILDLVLSERMKAVLFSIVPDPVLYHCHIYEIAANNPQSHIFSETLAGWHRDPDSTFVAHDPTHVSIFVYLSHVGKADGAFEFVPAVSPDQWLHRNSPFISVQGPAGYSFAWHRSYYHRASPNRGPVRRRLLKISIQRNAYRSAHLSNQHFQNGISKIPPEDTRLDLLLGRYQNGKAPALPALAQPVVRHIDTNGVLNLPAVSLTKVQLIERARKAKRKMQGAAGDAPSVAYD